MGDSFVLPLFVTQKTIFNCLGIFPERSFIGLRTDRETKNLAIDDDFLKNRTLGVFGKIINGINSCFEVIHHIARFIAGFDLYRHRASISGGTRRNLLHPLDISNRFFDRNDDAIVDLFRARIGIRNTDRDRIKSSLRKNLLSKLKPSGQARHQNSEHQKICGDVISAEPLNGFFHDYLGSVSVEISSTDSGLASWSFIPATGTSSRVTMIRSPSSTPWDTYTSSAEERTIVSIRNSNSSF